MIFARKYEKRIILGTSDTWSTSHLSQQTREPAYYILDCWIFVQCTYLPGLPGGPSRPGNTNCGVSKLYRICNFKVS